MKAQIVPATSMKRVILGEAAPLDTPFTVEIFPTNVCNFRCVYCAQSTRPARLAPEYMSFAVFKAAMDSIRQFPRKIKLLLIAGLGEPLLHPDIAKMVAYAKKQEIAETIRIITNASLLTEEMSKRLIAAGLDSLKISIQGLTDEKYEEMCGRKVKVQDILRNIDYFYRHKSHCSVNIKIISNAFETASDEQRFYEMFGNSCDIINIEHLAAYQEEVDYAGIGVKTGVSQTRGSQEGHKNAICQFPFFFCSVYPDGTVIPCCLLTFSKFSKFSLGNVTKDSLYTIWNTTMDPLRLTLLSGKRHTLPVCADCSEAFTSQCRQEDNIDPYRDLLAARIRAKYKTNRGK